MEINYKCKEGAKTVVKFILEFISLMLLIYLWLAQLMMRDIKSKNKGLTLKVLAPFEYAFYGLIIIPAMFIYYILSNIIGVIVAIIIFIAMISYPLKKDS